MEGRLFLTNAFIHPRAGEENLDKRFLHKSLQLLGWVVDWVRNVADASLKYCDRSRRPGFEPLSQYFKNAQR